MKERERERDMCVAWIQGTREGKLKCLACLVFTVVGFMFSFSVCPLFFSSCCKVGGCVCVRFACPSSHPRECWPVARGQWGAPEYNDMGAGYMLPFALSVSVVPFRIPGNNLFVVPSSTWLMV